MTLAKCSNGSEMEKTDFKKSLEKFIKTKWIHTDCVPEKNEKLRFPLVHWACILGKYKPLEYLVSEKGFELTVKVGKNKLGPLHSMVQHLSSGLNPKSSKEYTGNMFGYIVDIFLKYVPEVLSEKDASLGDTILHFLAKRCSSNPFSRIYLKILLAKVKESDKVTPDKVEEILSAVNKRGDTFLHLIVSDDASVDSLDYFFKHFGTISEKISKAKNNFGKTPRQLAVEKRSFEMVRALGAPDVVINSMKKAVAGGKPPTPKRVRFADGKGGQRNTSSKEQSTKTSNNRNASSLAKSVPPGDQEERENITGDQLQAEVTKSCSYDPPSESKEQANGLTSPTKRTAEPFPQPEQERDEDKTTDTPEDTELPEIMDVDMIHVPDDTAEITTNSSDRNVFLSLSNTVNSLTKGDSMINSRKRPAPRILRSTRPNKKRGRAAAGWSDSESDVEDDEDLALDDDSDDDLESDDEDEEEEEEEKEEKKVENDEVADIPNKGKDTKSAEADDMDLETGMSVFFPEWCK